jgi:ATP-dependent DNA helicase RecG
MTSALETLGKILRLEQEQGYNNKAVIGGLEALAKTWPVEAVKENPATTPVVEQIAALLRDYGSLSDPAARQARVVEVLDRLAACHELIAAPPARPSPPAKAAEAVRPAPSPPRTSTSRLGLDSPVTVLSGVGKTQAKRLQRLGVSNIYDLLHLFPRRYNDFSALKTIDQLEYGEEVTIIGTIWETQSRRTRGGIDGDHFMVCPPLIVSEAQIGEIMEKLTDSLEALAQEMTLPVSP